MEVLVEEVVSLTRERDSLSRQLAYSTLSLQQLTASGQTHYIITAYVQISLWAFGYLIHSEVIHVSAFVMHP